MDRKDAAQSVPFSNSSRRQDCRTPLYELKVVREPSGYAAAAYLESPLAVFQTFRERYEQLDREEFLVILLDNKNRMLGYNVVSVGSLTASIVHPREVFKAAVITNGARMLLMHNHPSGDPAPSKEDIDITKRLKTCGEIFGIQILDHIIMGEGRYFSFSEQGMM